MSGLFTVTRVIFLCAFGLSVTFGLWLIGLAAFLQYLGIIA